MNVSTIVPIVVIVIISVFLFLLSRRISAVEETLSDLVLQHNNAANKLNSLATQPEAAPAQGIVVKDAEPEDVEPKKKKSSGKEEK